MVCGLFIAMHRLLSNCNVQAPERRGSVVVAPGLSFPAACEILVHQPGIKPTSPALEGRFLTTGPQGGTLLDFLKLFSFALLHSVTFIHCFFFSVFLLPYSFSVSLHTPLSLSPGKDIVIESIFYIQMLCNYL